MPEFLFDVTLRATVRAQGETWEEARKNLIRDFGDAETVNLGSFENGDPILGEVSIGTDDLMGFELVDLAEEEATS